VKLNDLGNRHFSTRAPELWQIHPDEEEDLKKLESNDSPYALELIGVG
jgi:hypothetical protein